MEEAVEDLDMAMEKLDMVGREETEPKAGITIILEEGEGTMMKETIKREVSS